MDTQPQPSEITPEQAAQQIADSIEVLAHFLADSYFIGGDKAVSEMFEQIGGTVLETLNLILENQQQTEH